MKNRLTPEAVTSAALGGMLSVFPLFCFPYRQMVLSKYIILWVLAGGYVLAMVPALLRSRDRGRRDPAVPALVGGYLLLTLVSGLRSPYNYNFLIGLSRREGLLTQVLYGLLCLGMARYGRLRPWHLRLFGGTMLVFCGICLLQFLGRNPLWLYPQGLTWQDAGVRYSGAYLGTTGNADLTAALLSLAAGVFWGMLLKGKRKGDLLWLLPFLSCAGVLWYSGVSAGRLSLLALILVLTPLGLRLRGAKGWKWVLGAEALICLLALGAVYARDFGGTLGELHQVLHGHLEDSYGSHRVQIWREVLERMPEHLLLGTGPDSMQAWRLPGFSRYSPEAGTTIRRSIDAAHCEILGVAAQQGLPAALCFLALPALGLVRFCRSREKQALLPVLGGVLGYGVQGLFGISMCVAAPLWWVFLGLLLRVAG